MSRSQLTCAQERGFGQISYQGTPQLGHDERSVLTRLYSNAYSHRARLQSVVPIGTDLTTYDDLIP